MKNLKGIPCNETRFTNGKNRDRISFRFVTEDRITPSSCTVRIGDTDPMTGEVITDMGFFREYYKLADYQVRRNLQAVRPPCTEDRKAWREEETQRYIREFEQDYGYTPSKDDIRYHLEQLETDYNPIWIDDLEFNEDTVFLAVPAEDPFGTDLPEAICALREIEASLSPRLKDVYQAMLQLAGGGAERTTYADLTDRWGVSYPQIIKDRQKILKMIREKLKSCV